METSRCSPPAPYIDENVLRARGLIKGRYDRIKILGDGELTKSVTVSAHSVLEGGCRED